jgi:hypothetical protein
MVSITPNANAGEKPYPCRFLPSDIAFAPSLKISKGVVAKYLGLADDAQKIGVY